MIIIGKVNKYHLPSIDRHFPVDDASKLRPYSVHLETPRQCAHWNPSKRTKVTFVM